MKKMQLMVIVGAKSCLRSETPRTLVVAMVILGACYIYIYTRDLQNDIAHVGGRLAFERVTEPSKQGHVESRATLIFPEEL